MAMAMELKREKDLPQKRITGRLYAPDTNYHLYVKDEDVVCVGQKGSEPSITFPCEGNDIAIKLAYAGMKKLMETCNHDVFKEISELTFTSPWHKDVMATEEMNKIITAYTTTNTEKAARMVLENPAFLGFIRKLDLTL